MRCLVCLLLFLACEPAYTSIHMNAVMTSAQHQLVVQQQQLKDQLLEQQRQIEELRQQITQSQPLAAAAAAPDVGTSLTSLTSPTSLTPAPPHQMESSANSSSLPFEITAPVTNTSVLPTEETSTSPSSPSSFSSSSSQMLSTVFERLSHTLSASRLMSIARTKQTCASGMEAVEGKCLCNANTVLVDGVCVRCPEHSQTFGVRRDGWVSCVCGDGLSGNVTDGVADCVPCGIDSYSVNGHCVRCPFHSSTDSQIAQTTCQCFANTYMHNGECIDCPANTSSVPGATKRSDCTCDTGYIRDQRHGVIGCYLEEDPTQSRMHRLVVSTRLVQSMLADSDCDSKECQKGMQLRAMLRWVEVSLSAVVQLHVMMSTSDLTCPMEAVTNTLLWYILSILDLSKDLIGVTTAPSAAYHDTVVGLEGLQFLSQAIILANLPASTSVFSITTSSRGGRIDPGYVVVAQQLPATQQAQEVSQQAQTDDVVGVSVMRLKDVHSYVVYDLGDSPEAFSKFLDTNAQLETIKTTIGPLDTENPKPEDKEKPKPEWCLRPESSVGNDFQKVTLTRRGKDLGFRVLFYALTAAAGAMLIMNISNYGSMGLLALQFVMSVLTVASGTSACLRGHLVVAHILLGLALLLAVVELSGAVTSLSPVASVLGLMVVSMTMISHLVNVLMFGRLCSSQSKSYIYLIPALACVASVVVSITAVVALDTDNSTQM